MKNIDIKGMNAEQRETYLLMSVKTWQAIVMEDIISQQFGQFTIDVCIEELRLRVKLLNNIRMMKGKKQLTAFMLSHNLT